MIQELIHYQHHREDNKHASHPCIITPDVINDWITEYFDPTLDSEYQLNMFMKAGRGHLNPKMIRSMLNSHYKMYMHSNKAPFMCDKETVNNIINFQGNKKNGFGDELGKVRNYIKTLPDTFPYDVFLNKCMSFESTKLAVSTGAFLNPFKARMRKYKQGKDWTNI